NGNTLICSGTNGNVFEVTPKSEIVWKYGVSALGGGMGGFGGKGFGGFDPKKGEAQKDDKKGIGGQFPGIGGFGGMSPGGMTFRALRFGPDDPALTGRKLTPEKS